MAEIVRPVELYRPSNGTEGDGFMGSWCAKCKHDELWNGTEPNPDKAKMCPIIANSMAFDTDEPGYPQEWIRDQNGTPRCLAFEPVEKPERCQNTIDMFTGRKG